MHIGRYELIRKLGKGGMGSVYKALVPVINKVVALKLLDPFDILLDIVGLDQLKETFIFEAETMAAINHPAVVNVWDFGEDDQGRPYFIMEYFCNNLGVMIGEDFDMNQPCRASQPEMALHYGRQLLEGLDCLHQHQIIHRDIKPYNLLITDNNQLKICDFGMALVKGISFTGGPMVQVGSPYYAAPEQQRDAAKVDGRADLYSVGVLLYRMLTGSFPSMANFSLSLVNPLYDKNWDIFFSRALSLSPQQRFQSATEMLNSLDNLHLHWQGQRQTMCTLRPATTKASNRPLRTEATNSCGSKARALFQVNEQYRPTSYVHNNFQLESSDLITDQATGLRWHIPANKYGIPLAEAQEYIARLNSESHGGCNSWRLPTINELLTLLDEDNNQANTLPPGQKWLWSCDRHGQRDSWYVNMEMGFVGWQDISCRNFIRPVSVIKTK